MAPTDATGKAVQTSGVSPSIRRRPYIKKPLPRLPDNAYKIVHRPRGGLRLRDHTATTLLYALCLDIGVNFGEIKQHDQVMINPFNNSFTVSTPSMERAGKYAEVQHIKILDQVYSTCAYVAAPDNSIKGIAYHVLEDQSHAKIMDDIVKVNPQLEISDARRMGKSSKALFITFANTKRVPDSIRFGGGIHNCNLFRPIVEACYNCRRPGHRLDVCPEERRNLCYKCGDEHPVQDEPTCTPKCILCKGEHFTGSKQCKIRYARPPAKGNRKQNGKPQVEFQRPEEQGAQPAHPKQLQQQRGRSRSRNRAQGNDRGKLDRSESYPALPNAWREGAPHQFLGCFHGFFCGDAALSSVLPFHRHVDGGDGVPMDCPVTPVGDSPGIPRGFADGLPHASLLADVIVALPITTKLRSATSTPDDIKVLATAPSFSGQNSNDAGMLLKRCLFFTQACYIQGAYSYRSDDRFLLLLFCPNSVVTCCFRILHCYHSLILSGGVELYPGPRGVPSASTSTSSEANNTTTSSSQCSPSSPPETANLLAQLLAGQKQTARDITDIKESFNSRFEALETRVSWLESSTAAVDSGATYDKLKGKLKRFSISMNCWDWE
ncbi:uncharacterized protein [Dermacentor albipictus]|uniref:uncharacterized protein n=1 Tax=Dermacentor albipictus TaxID=60249 RepID=UPI0031FBA505